MFKAKEKLTKNSRTLARRAWREVSEDAWNWRSFWSAPGFSMSFLALFVPLRLRFLSASHAHTPRRGQCRHNELRLRLQDGRRRQNQSRLVINRRYRRLKILEFGLDLFGQVRCTPVGPQIVVQPLHEPLLSE